MTPFSLLKSQSQKATLTIKACTKQGFFPPASSFFKKILPTQARNLGVFLTSHPFPAPAAKRSLRLVPLVCFLPIPWLWPGLRPHPLLSPASPWPASRSPCFQPLRALSDSDLALSLSFCSKAGHTSLHKQDKVYALQLKAEL